MYFLRMLFYLLFPRIACALVMKWLNNICFFLFITQLSHGNGAASGSRAVKQLADGGDDNKVSPRESEQQQQDTAAQIIQKIWCPAIGDVSTTDVCQGGGRNTVTAFSSVGHITIQIAQLLDQLQSGGAVAATDKTSNVHINEDHVTQVRVDIIVLTPESSNGLRRKQGPLPDAYRP